MKFATNLLRRIKQEAAEPEPVSEPPKAVAADTAPALPTAETAKAEPVVEAAAQSPAIITDAPAPQATPAPTITVDADSALPEAATGGLLTIDLTAIVANWKKLGQHAMPAECAAVVKADAYGCGLTPVTRALAEAGCKTFFVATLDEARRAREAATPEAAIYVLNGFFAGCGDIFAKLDARPVIGDLTEFAEWEAFRKTSGWRGGAAVHIDTGMNRLGFTMGEAQALLPRLSDADHGISLVMSHLACAETPDHPLNGRQIGAFREIAHAFAGVPASLANSSGICLGSSAQFDLVRPGAGLYGVNPTPDAENPMHAVVELKARVVQIRQVERGESVGYGATWTARHPTRLAIVSTGYGDGYFRSAGGVDGTRSAEAIVGKQRCPLAGRISMDLMAIDITDTPERSVRRGDYVTMIGDGITVDELAHHYGTIGYEVLTSLGARYRRRYRQPA